MKAGQFLIQAMIEGTNYYNGAKGLIRLKWPMHQYSEDNEHRNAILKKANEAERKAMTLPGFDTIEEAKEAAAPLIKKRVPFLWVCEFTQTPSLRYRKRLTEADGSRTPERTDK